MTFYTANISQSTGMGTRQKNPKGKTMKSIHKNDREKILSCILQNFISINSLHIVSGLSTNNTKEEKNGKSGKLSEISQFWTKH